MINKLRIVDSQNLNPYKNMQLEEFLLHDVAESECILYLWQNEHTVVIGRNQNAWKECRIDELQKDNGYLARRLSGGGAVYHDLGNLNFTFLVQKHNYNVDMQLEVILRAVKLLGIDAVKSGRNDLLIDGRKFSGNAFYKTGKYCYHHGTIMLNVNTDTLTKYLSGSAGKLVSKGVESVRSRVINISEAYGKVVDTALMKKCLSEAFEEVYRNTYGGQVFLEEQTIVIDDADTENATDFASWEWIYGRNIDFDHEITITTPRGRIGARLHIEKGCIEEAVADTDFMEPIDTAAVESELIGMKFSEDKVKAILMKYGGAHE